MVSGGMQMCLGIRGASDILTSVSYSIWQIGETNVCPFWKLSPWQNHLRWENAQLMWLKGMSIGDVQRQQLSSKKFRIKIVLCIFGLSTNLFSIIRQIGEQSPHAKALFTTSKWMVKHRSSRKLLTSGVEEHGLYRFVNVTTKKSEDVADSLEITDNRYTNADSLWHQRYGHLCFPHLSLLSMLEMVVVQHVWQ